VLSLTGSVLANSVTVADAQPAAVTSALHAFAIKKASKLNTSVLTRHTWLFNACTRSCNHQALVAELSV